MRVRISHVLRYELDGVTGAACDAVARAASGGPDGNEPRFFLPGRLPCGICALCRRGLVAACTAALDAFPSDLDRLVSDGLELPERFLTPVDEPLDVDPLPSDLAAGAGLVALGIQAAAAANLTPGDVAIWLGGGPVAQVGAQLTAAKGARTFLVGEDLPDRPPAPALTCFSAAPEVWGTLLDDGGAPGAGHQRSVRRVFLSRTDPVTLQSAARATDAGASLLLIGRGPARLPTELELPPEARLTRVSGYHPDLIPEALALLRRGEVRTPPASWTSARED